MVVTRPLEDTFPMSNFVSGRHFLQTPGPTNLPDRVLRAMDRNAINHRGPEFGALGREIVAKLRAVFQTAGGHDRDLSGLRHRRLGIRAGQHAGRPATAS